MASLSPKIGVLGRKLAKHLLKRTTFGPTKLEIESFASKTVETAVADLLVVPPPPPPPIDPETGATWVINGADATNSPSWRLVNYVVAWWVDSALKPGTPSIASKMVFFLHTRFTTDLINLESEDDYYLLRLFWQYALGSYKTVARKICMDNSMMQYLDTRYSHRWNPNENFPRELLELFTIGKGPQIGANDYTTYTEADIVEAAKVLTGFRQNHDWWDSAKFDADTNLPMGTVDLNSHDSNDKIFSDAFASPAFPSPVTIVGRDTEAGMFDELDDLIEMIFAQDATALNITRKIYQFFVHYDITEEVETDIIQPLAAILKNNDYDLKITLETLFKSEHFYDEGGTIPEEMNVGGMIKSPIEYIIGTIRFFDVTLPDPVTEPETYYRYFHRDSIQLFLLQESGMSLYNPPNVAGYPAYHQEPTFNRLWISANTLPFRYTLPEMLFTGQKVTTWGSLYMDLDVMALVTNKDIVPDVTGPDPFDGVVGTYAGGRFADHLVRSLVDYVFPEEPSVDRFNYFLNDLLLDNLSPINWRFEWVDFEATGDESQIKPQIEALVRGILQAPEYHLG